MNNNKFIKKNKVYNIVISKKEDEKRKVIVENGLSYDEGVLKYKKYLEEKGFNIYDSNTHLCGKCENMLKCPKVLDKYKLQVSEENYSFILECFQMISDETKQQQKYIDEEFYVPGLEAYCEYFHISECKNFVLDKKMTSWKSR